MITKEELREKAKNIRKLLYMEKISEKICANFINTEIYDAAEHIMLFYPLAEEINLITILKDKTKKFYLPRVEGDDLVVCPYKHGDKLKNSAFNTKEPTTKPVSPEILDIIIIPALMAGKNFQRIGYGKGFYDKFLNRNNSILKAIRIVPVPSVLTVGSLPYDENDAIFDIILDEL